MAATAGRRVWPGRVRRVSPGPTGRRTLVMVVWAALVVPAVPVAIAVPGVPAARVRAVRGPPAAWVWPRSAGSAAPAVSVVRASTRATSVTGRLVVMPGMVAPAGPVARRAPAEPMPRTWSAAPVVSAVTPGWPVRVRPGWPAPMVMRSPGPVAPAVSVGPAAPVAIAVPVAVAAAAPRAPGRPVGWAWPPPVGSVAPVVSAVRASTRAASPTARPVVMPVMVAPAGPAVRRAPAEPTPQPWSAAPVAPVAVRVWPVMAPRVRPARLVPSGPAMVVWAALVGPAAMAAIAVRAAVVAAAPRAVVWVAVWAWPRSAVSAAPVVSVEPVGMPRV